ncbi:MAG: sigma-70 family RNA polymerase sigma factor [Acidobacteriota bacterium]
MERISQELAERLYRQANAARWAVTPSRFAAALQASAERAPGAAAGLQRYLEGLHLDDLALACACAEGNAAAWDHFIRQHRPGLYRAADALDRGGAARELADSLYADLYGTTAPEEARRSLFRYFHGRSSLATWLRAVLAQRHVDAIRTRRRLDPLPDDDAAVALVSPAPPPSDPDRPRYLALVQRALRLAISVLAPRDRLRLACYYAQELSLAQTGRVLGEHEATASRQLARTRRGIRAEIERYLRNEGGLDAEQISRSFEYAMETAGPLDLSDIARKEPASGRSIS